MDKEFVGTKRGKTWEIASKLVPLRLYHFLSQNKLNEMDAGATGVYVLYSFRKHQFYVGRSEKADLRSRLQRYLEVPEEKFNIFNYRLGKDPKEAHDLECALFHILPKDLLMNKNHPQAIDERECLFCST